MTISGRQEKIDKLKTAFDDPRKAQAMRYVLAMMGSIPVVGGAIAGAGANWAEREQKRTNDTLLDWASLADNQINELLDAIDRLPPEPTHSSMAVLIRQLVGDFASETLSGVATPVVLNPASVAELEPYIANQWLSLESTGALCSMGSGNRVGNHIEELKRPYGLGNGFVMTVRALKERR